MLLDEIKGVFKKCPDFRPFLTLEELRAGRNQRLHHSDAILSGTT